MATAVTTDTVFTRMGVLNKMVTADSTGGVAAGWVDLRGFEGCGFLVTATALTGVGLTALVIQGSTVAAGTSPGAVLTVDLTGLTPDAVGDTVVASVTAQQLEEVGGYRYINALVTCDNAADDVVVTYVRYPATRAYDGLTTNVIAA